MKIITWAVALLLSFYAFPQASIKGKITDEANQPLIGATVYISELNKGNMTDLNGDYKVGDIEEGSWTVIVRMLGYQTQTKKITIETNSSLNYDVVLQEDPNDCAL